MSALASLTRRTDCGVFVGRGMCVVDQGPWVLNQSICNQSTHVEDLREQLPVVGVRASRPAGVLVAAPVAGLAAVEEELKVPAGAGAEHGHVVEVGGRALHHRLGSRLRQVRHGYMA